MPAESLLESVPLARAISSSFSSVFSELNVEGEAWYQHTKLLTIGRRRYAEYLTETVGRFPLFLADRTVAVDQAYVSVKLANKIRRHVYKSRKNLDEQLLRQARGGLSEPGEPEDPVSALEKSDEPHFALVGTPGSGKTTAFRYLAIVAARGDKLRGSKRISIYLAVRDLDFSGSTPIRDAAVDFLEGLGIEEAEKVFEFLLWKGRLFLLLDGLDEVSAERQGLLVDELRTLRVNTKSILAVSGRPHSLAIGLEQFSKWEILQLSIQQRRELVAKWFGEVDQAKGQRLLADLGETASILDIGSTPLLLSTVCALFNNDLEIPVEEHELYRRLTEGFCGQWDAFRNIRRQTSLAGITIHKRVVLLSWLAVNLFERGKITFTPEELRETGALSLASSHLRAPVPDEHALCASLADDYGVLVEQAPGVYSFSHLTLQEFLIAKYAVEQRREIELFYKHWDDKRWANVFRLVAQLLPDATGYLEEMVARFDAETFAGFDLISACIKAKPVCSAKILQQLLRQVASRAAAVLSERFPPHHFDGESFVVNLSDLTISEVEEFLLSNRVDSETATAGDVLDLTHELTRQFSELSDLLKVHGFPFDRKLTPEEELLLRFKVGATVIFEGFADTGNIYVGY